MPRPSPFRRPLRGSAAAKLGRLLKKEKSRPVFTIPDILNGAKSVQPYFWERRRRNLRYPLRAISPDRIPTPLSSRIEEDPVPNWERPSLGTSGSLAGKWAIITGASRGIGAAIAERFAKEGAKCILVGRDEEALTKVKEGLMGEYKTDHVVKVGDVTDREFWKRVYKAAKTPDILVNAAGITQYNPLFRTPLDQLEKMVHTNLIGTMLACQLIGRRMLGRKAIGGGCIINISSLLALKGGTGSVGYAASKAGVIGLTRALAAEVGKEGIRVNVIVPGYVESNMTAAMTPAARLAAIAAIPLGRFGHASEIASAALFLATNDYANNCVLNLDGGLSAT